MLSLTPRHGAGRRYRARALIVSLALAASLAAADLSPNPSLARGRAVSLTAHSQPAAAPTDPDAALQRLAEETDRIKPSAPDAVARLRTVLRGLIEIERAQRREIAALRASPSVGSATASHRRSRKKSAPAADTSPPVAETSSPAAKATGASGTPATAAAPAPSGALFGKRGLKKVHRAGCVFGERIRPEDRVYFKNVQEAAAAGYEACKICRPGGG